MISSLLTRFHSLLSKLSPILSKFFKSHRTLKMTIIVAGGFILAYTFQATYYYYQLSRLKNYVPPSELETHFGPVDELRMRVINLDDSLLKQHRFLKMYLPHIYNLQTWGPPLRMDCSYRTFFGFEKALSHVVGSETDDDYHRGRPLITFYGSNDFHHVALVLIRRFRQPFNLVIFDNHPDWIRMYPALHCGCWFNHAMNLPTVQKAFHFGGASGEFTDTSMSWFFPWKEMIEGKLTVFPPISKFTGMKWNEVDQKTLHEKWYQPITKERITQLLEPHRESLEKYPLYITLDKDSIVRKHNLQNWNSGDLTRSNLLVIIEVLIEMSGGRLLAVDITGDYSKVKTKGVYRSYLHHTQHSPSENQIYQMQADILNEETNHLILTTIKKSLNLHDDKLGYFIESHDTMGGEESFSMEESQITNST